MAINAYTGLQGSGKSYEVVSSVILPAIAQGRRVVTNIDGIDERLVHEYLQSVNKSIGPEELGQIIHVTNDRILEPAFFPDEARPDIESLVLPGDMVAIDEAWRFWPTDGGKLTHEHMQFFRMHRHYTHPETGVACDVALMIQDISGLHRSVKNVVEFSFRTTKHKMLGLKKRYRVEVYEGYKQLRTNAISRYQKDYDPAIFPLYRSYSTSNGTEVAIDGRINVFRRWWLVPVIAMIVISCAGSVWYLAYFFGQKGRGKASATSSPVSVGSGLATPAANASPAGSQSFSQAWRIAGTVTLRGNPYVVLANPTGRMRLEHPSNFINTGSLLIGRIDGETVTVFSGGVPPPMLSAPASGASK